MQVPEPDRFTEHLARAIEAKIHSFARELQDRMIEDYTRQLRARAHGVAMQAAAEVFSIITWDMGKEQLVISLKLPEEKSK